MTVYQIDLQAKLGTEYWTNVYHVDKATIGDAVTDAGIIANIHAGSSHEDVTIDRARVSEYGVEGFIGWIINFNLPGEQGAYDYMPLWNVVRCDFNSVGQRPGRKYLKWPLNETYNNKGQLTTAALTQYQTFYADVMMTSVTGLCSPNGLAYATLAINPTIGMRQLRRGSKKRTTPVI